MSTPIHSPRRPEGLRYLAPLPPPGALAFLLWMASLFLGIPGLYAAITAPTVETGTAFSGAYSTNETVYAVVNPNGAATSVAFEYGLSTNYGGAVLASPLPAGFQVAPVTAVLGGLTPGAQYHYRVVATNSAGASVGSDRTFTARNETIEVLAHYRMGEMDGANYSMAASGSEAVSLVDSVGNHSIPMVNPSTFGSDIITAQPVYSTQVAPASSSDAGSSRSLDFANGNAYAMSGVFFPWADNFCLEAWVKASSLSDFQFIAYNGSGGNGWGLCLDRGVYKACSRTTHFASYFGEDFGFAPASLTEWTHLALVSNNGQVTFYANGLPAGSPKHPLSLDGGVFTLGKGPNFISRFGGQIDEVRLSQFPGGQFNVTNLLYKSIPPKVSRSTVTSLESQSAVVGGTVEEQGGPRVTECGIVYSRLSQNELPTVAGTSVTKVKVSEVSGTFATTIAGLEPATAYVFRPYAVSSAGITYGPVGLFATDFVPLVHYRLGEVDPGAAVGGVASTTIDSLGGTSLALFGTPTYSSDTASGQESLLSLDWSSGVAYGKSSSWPVFTDNFGFEAWVKPTTTSGTHFILYNGPADRSGWGIFQNGAAFQVLYGGQVIFGSAPVTVNQWTHLAVVRDGGVSTFYVNGIASGTTLAAPLAPDGGPGFALGADPLLPSESRWIGSLDEMRLFAFRPGQFRMANLLLFRPEIDLEQPAGTGVADGDIRGFGGVPVGTGSSLSFKLRNVGNWSLTGVAVSIDGLDAAQFSVTAGPAASVDAGADSPFEIRFAPSGYGVRTAVLHILSNDPDENPFEVTLTGMGIAPEIAVEQPLGRSLTDGDAQDFGVVDTSSGKTLIFTVRNLGNADLFLNGTPMVTVKGGHASDFSLVAQPSRSVLGAAETGLTNAGFETPALGVAASAYSPGGTGWTIGNAAGVGRNGSPWFAATAPEGVQAAFLQRNLPGSFVARTQNFPEPGNYTIRFSLVRRGLGFEANDVEVRMDGVSLGRVSNTLQSDDVWRTFTVDYDCTVPGNHTLSFVGVRSGGDYTSALDDIQILHEATFQVRFAPTVGGPQTATLSIDNNDPDEAPFDLVLRGTGVALPELAVFTGDSLAPIDERADGVGTFNFFGTVVGERSAAQKFTIRNTGVGDLTGLSVSVSGANPSDFVVEPTGATTLGPNETTTFSVTFGPGAAGARRAVVAIASNDADENPFEVNVSGTGILPLPKLVVEQPAGTNLLNGANRDFGAVEVGGSRELDFTLRNMGAGDLVLNGAPRIVIAGANSADFAVTMEPGSPVPIVNLVGADFESPGLGLTAWAHRPIGTGWIYEGQAGVSKNGAGWFVNGAPSGGQAAFLQNALPGEGGGAKISQEASFDRTGDYLIRFSLVRRGNGTEGTDLAVRMDGVELGTVLNVRQPDDVWRTFTVPYSCTTPGRHILTFEGTRTGGDYASAIDDVQILGATTFRVRFTPSTWGVRSAMLSIASNDASENPFKVFVTGMGLAAEIAVEQPAGTPQLGGANQDLGAVSVGGETNLSFTLRNMGNADLVLNGAPRVAVGGPHASDFTITKQPGSPVLGGVASAVLGNPDFELTGLGSNGWLYSPGGSAWNFGSKAGVAHNGSPWYANPAPSGAQAAFVQSILAGGDAASTFSQEVSLAEPGEYQVRFSVVRRGFGYSGTDLAVRMDGVTLGTVPSSSQPDDVWRTFAVPYVCTESGRHTLSFVGTRGGGDFSSAVDDVQILGSTQFQVRFAPAAGGLRTATLSIESNDPDEVPYELTLTGTGVFFPEISAFTGVGTAVGNELADNVGTNRFEAVLVGGKGESQTFTLRNSGNADLTDLSVLVEGAHSGDFVVGPLGATTLAPNATTTFTVTFVPTAGGVRRAVVSIASNDGDENPFEIQLSGEGTVAPEIAVFTGSGASLGGEWTNHIGTNVYSGTLVGEVGPSQTFTVKNSGTAHLTGLAVSVTGAHPGDFAVGSLGATMLAPNATATFSVTFIPSAGGSRHAVVSIASNDGDENPFEIHLAGEGIILPEIAVETPGSGDLMSGTTNDFGVVPLGESRELTFVLRNSGRADLILSGTPGAVVSGPDAADYEVTMQPESLVPGVRGSVDLVNSNFDSPEAEGAGWEYAPNGTGWIFGITTGVARDGSPWFLNAAPTGNQAAFVQSNREGGDTGATISQDVYFGETGPSLIRFSVVRRGNGFEGTDLAVKMDGVTLGTVPHGSQPDDVWRTFSVPYVCTTPGLHRLSFVGTRRGGDYASALDDVQIVGATQFRVRFTPSAEGLRTARLSIANNDPDEDPYELTLTGTGAVSPEISVFTGTGTAVGDDRSDNVGTYVFAATRVGGMVGEQVFTIKNSGTVDLTGLAVSLQGANAGDFVVGPLGATTLAPNATTTFTVTFLPTAAGVRRAEVAIASNDGDENPFEIQLSGEGTVAPEIAVFTGLGTAAGDERVNQVGTNEFGATLLGKVGRVQSFTIKNAGNSDLTGLVVSVTGANPGDFVVGLPGATSLAPNVTTTFTVTFVPTAGGLREGVVSIVSNDGDENPFEIHLAGEGVLRPEIAVERSGGGNVANGATQEFGGVAVGESGALTFALRNLGNADLVLSGIPRVVVSGPDAEDFVVTMQPESPVPGSATSIGLANGSFELPGLGAGGWGYSPSGSGWSFGTKSGLAGNGSPWFVNATPSGGQAAFLQSSPTDREADATISQEIFIGAVGDYQIRFGVVRRGFGYSGTDLAVKMDGVTLGTVPHGSQPDDVWRTFSVPYVCTTPGQHRLSFVGTREGGDYASALDDVQIVGTTQFQVRFTPSAGGLRTARLSIANNDPDEDPYELTLTGTGLVFPEISVFSGAGTAVGNELADNVGANRFEAVLVGGKGESQTFTLRNSGNADLTELSVVVEGAHSGDFVVGPLGATTLAPNATTTFTVTFVPTAGGVRRAVVSIASNDGDENPFEIQLSGEGTVAPEIAVFTGSGTALGAEWTNHIGTNVYSGTLVGEVGPSQTFTVKNSGTAHLTGLAVSVTGANPGDFVVGSLGATMLAPNASTTFTVTFVPTGGGLREGVVSIVSNDGDENPFEVHLAGEGVLRPEIAVERSGGGNVANGATQEFGSVAVGESGALTFALRNLGNADLVLSGIPRVVVSGPDAEDFVVTMQPESPVPGSATSIGLANGSFELPGLGAGGWGYSPSGSGWSFGTKSGLAGNGSPWFVNATPSGGQAAFVQSTLADGEPGATISQEVSIVAAGEYQIRFGVVRRGYGFEGTDLAVKMDGVTLGTVPHGSQPDDVWRTFSVPYVCTTPGQHRLSFVGTREGGDYASALDDVQIVGATRFQVRFTPSAGGLRTAKLSITNNDPDEDPYELTLTGTGGVSPEISVFSGAGTAVGDERSDNVGTYVFAATRVGGMAGEQVFTIKNSGTVDLTGLAVSVLGANAGDFVIESLGATTLAPNATTTFTVTFVPTAAGARRAVVSIASNDGDENPFEIQLSGEGTVAPEIAVFTGLGTAAGDERVNQVGTNEFEATFLGKVGGTQSFTIKNVGTSDLTGLVVSVTGTNPGDFVVGSLGATMLAPNATTTFTVMFVPTAEGLREGVVSIASNDGDENPFEINLSGKAGTDPEIAVFNGLGTTAGNEREDGVGATAFSATAVGGASASQTFTVWNAGAADLTDLAVAVTGPNPGDFVVGPLGATTLAPNATTTFTVTFVPTAAGVRRAEVAIASNDGDENPFEIQLSGEGTVAPEIAVFTGLGTAAGDERVNRMGTNEFGVALLGKVGGTQSFTIKNAGTSDLTGLVVSVTGTNPGDFVVGSLGATMLAPNATTTFTVMFVPTAEGLREGVVSIASNDGDENPFEINLSGKAGTAPEIALERMDGTPLEHGASEDFGSVGIGVTRELTFILRNQGDTELVLSGTSRVAVEGPNASDFTVTTQPESPVPGGRLSLDLADPAFESPGLGVGEWAYRPGGTSWVFGARSGTAHNGSPWFVNPAPSGAQAAFVQNTLVEGEPGATLSQEITVGRPGNYQISFSVVRRGNGSQGTDLAVRMDGVTLGVVMNGSQPDDVWRTFTVPYECSTAGRHVLSFVGTRSGGDFASALDDIRILGATSFRVRFTPSAAGLREATLSIASNDADENPFQLLVTGKGLTPRLAVELSSGIRLPEDASLPLGWAAVGDGTNFNFTLRNLGEGDLVLGGTPRVLVGGADAGDFSVTSQPESPVLGGENSVGVANSDFETPNQGSGTFAFNPSGADWTFGSQAGLAHNGSVWFVNPAPSGEQAAFIRCSLVAGVTGSSLSQEINFAAPGLYQVRFFAVRRSSRFEATDLDVRVDGVTLGTVSNEIQSDDEWRLFSVPYVCATPGRHTLAFVGTRLGGNYGSALDQVQVLGAASFQVRFTPSAAGTRTATLSLESNDTEPNPHVYRIQATGLNGPPQAPAFTSADHGDFTVGDAGSFTVTADGEPAPTFSTPDALPDGLTLSPTGVLSGTPAVGTFGSYPLTIRASNGVDPEAVQSFTLTVLPAPNRAPTLGQPSNAVVDEQVPFSIQLSAVDPDLPSQMLTYDRVSGPEGLTVSMGGVVTWTPTKAQGPGSYPVEVRVTDNGVPPLSDRKQFTVVVNDVPDPVVRTVWQIGTDNLRTEVPYNPTGEFSIEDTKNTPPPGQVTLAGLPFGASGNPAQDDDFYFSGNYPVGFNRLTTPLSVVADEPPLAWERALTRRDSTNRIHFVLDPTQVTGVSAFRLSFELLGGGGMSGGLLTGFGDHDIVVQFRNGAGVTTPILSRRVSAARTLVVEFAASAVGASAGANTIEFVRTGPNPPELTSNWIQFDYLRLESRPVNNTAPRLAQPSDPVVDEQSAFTMNLTATDAEMPAQTLTYDLVSGPEGLTVSGTGLVAWIPSESQGPGSYPVEVRVTDNGVPPLSDRKQFTVVVNEAPDLDVRRVWQIGTNNLRTEVPYRPSGEFSIEDTKNTPPPGQLTLAGLAFGAPGNPTQDDDFYFAGNYPVGFNRLTTPVSVVADEPPLAWERALTRRDSTNRIHFVLDPTQVTGVSAFRLSFELLGGGGMAGGLLTGFGDHDLVVQFRNGAGVTTPILSRRVSAATTLVVEFVASAVGASAGANTIEFVRTGPNPPELTSNWIQFDYLRLESLPGGSSGPGALGLATAARAAQAGPESRGDLPAIADLGEVRQGVVSVLGLDYLTLSYRRPEPAPSGVWYQVEGSSDLLGWSTEGMALLSREEEEGFWTITVRDGVPLGATALRFLRLRVEYGESGSAGDASRAPGH